MPCSEAKDVHNFELRSSDGEDQRYTLDNGSEWEDLRGHPDRVNEWLTELGYER